MKMKKLIPIVAAGLLAVVFASCTKEYTCVCTLTSGTSSLTTQTYDLGKKTRSDAKAECDRKEGAVLGLVYSCELK